MLSLLGIAVREDVLERQNSAAAWVVYGTLAGTAFCYTGANVGSGPGTQVVLFCAALSTVFLFGFWYFLERIFHLADQVTIGRDESAGIRIGGWISSVGLIFAAAVAGDWKSLESTVWDFIRYAWVTLLFLLAAILIEWTLKLSQKDNYRHRGASAAIAITYFVAAAIYFYSRGVR